MCLFWSNTECWGWGRIRRFVKSTNKNLSTRPHCFPVFPPPPSAFLLSRSWMKQEEIPACSFFPCLSKKRRVARSRGTRHSKGLNIIRKAEAVEASRHGARKCTRLKITWMNVGCPFIGLRSESCRRQPAPARKVSPLRLRRSSSSSLDENLCQPSRRCPLEVERV